MSTFKIHEKVWRSAQVLHVSLTYKHESTFGRYMFCRAFLSHLKLLAMNIAFWFSDCFCSFPSDFTSGNTYRLGLHNPRPFKTN